MSEFRFPKIKPEDFLECIEHQKNLMLIFIEKGITAMITDTLKTILSVSNYHLFVLHSVEEWVCGVTCRFLGLYVIRDSF